MQSKAKSVADYLAELPEDRRKAVATVRAVIRKNLPKGFKEQMHIGMIGYVVPHSIYPAGYHCDPKQPLPFICLGSQKNYVSLYMMGIYQDPGEARWLKVQSLLNGKKLDMGKCCVRFKKVEDLALDVIGQAVARVPLKEYVRRYEANLKRPARKTLQSQH
ncbi:MAG: DUF1801 domain-containing protein [Candidatus Solibacter usitatus]|nr:DUF1801 domain-containing protein [Candidatus Solibacter usitatus]